MAGLKRTPKRYTAKARALTNPQPNFVAMVRAGANQAPWQKVLKMAGEAPAQTQKSEELSQMFENVCKGGYEISQLVFRGENFPDEASVTKWLEDGGYEAQKIEGGPEKGTFQIVSDGAMEVGTMRRVDNVADGVSVYIGKPTGTTIERTSEEIAADQAEDQGSAIVDTAASVSKEDGQKAKPKGRIGMLAAKQENQSPTPEEALAAAIKTADDMLEGLTKKGINEVCELGVVLTRLKWMVEDAPYTEIPDTAVTKIKTAAGTLITALNDVMDQSATTLTEAFKYDKQEGSGGAENTGEGVEAGEQPAEAATGGSEGAQKTEGKEAEADPVLAAISGLATSIGELQGSVKSANDAIAQAKDDSAVSVKQLGERLEKLETSGQSRKGSNVVDGIEQPEDPEKAKRIAAQRQQRQRSIFGSQRANEVAY